MNRVYYYINEENKKQVEEFLELNKIENSFTYDPMEFVCEELTESYIENNIEEELKPLFRERKTDIYEYLLAESDNLIDGNMVIDILSNYSIE